MSPVSGKVRNFIGYKSKKPMLQITPYNPNLGIDRIEIMYVRPPDGLDYSGNYRHVSEGSVIGRSVNLQSLGYSIKVGPHVHIQMFRNGKRLDSTGFFFD